jgi:hypothetical protein
MNVHYVDFRSTASAAPVESAEPDVTPMTLAALLDYVAKDIDPTRYGVAHHMVVSAADWLRQHIDESPSR